MWRPLVILLMVCATRAAAAQEMVRVEGGPAQIGSRAGDPDERPVHSVTLRPFLLDIQEVTQGLYRRCVARGGCTQPRRYAGTVAPHLPVVGVTWHQARAYCRWAGRRLPTEAEWERAARGPRGRVYPWGDELDCKKANFGNYLGAGPCAAVNHGRVGPAGGRPAGKTPEGIDDLGGNVWEWVEDDYTPYPKARDGRPNRKKKRSKGPRLKVLRGGSCCSYFALPRGANRLAYPAGYRDKDIGFRCARDVDKEGEKRGAKTPATPLNTPAPPSQPMPVRRSP